MSDFTGVKAQLAGGLAVLITVLVILREFGWLLVAPLVNVAIVSLVLLLVAYVPRSRQVFVLIGALLSVANLYWNPEWEATLAAGLVTATFIAAFFTALTSLQAVAETSPAIKRCGLFLSQQPPGKRYVALTLGGQLFGLLLNYGAISLLGSMSAANVAQEPNAELRGHRIRRMLLAIQRGFISILPWSPFSFAIAISTALVPGVSWLEVAVPGLVSGFILASMGWLLDSLFKPKLSVPIPTRTALEDNWLAVMPLAVLLALLVAALGLAYLISGLRIQALVMMVVPLIALGWSAWQAEQAPLWRTVVERSRLFIFELIPGFRSEMVLLIMAGYLGTIASPLLNMLMNAMHIDLSVLPGGLVLVSIVWLLPLLGQLGMNPILATALLAPVLPDAALMGVTNSALVIAITAGWILSGVSSPFTATTLLVGKFGGVSSTHVGQRWNGLFTLLCGCLLSLWVYGFAVFLGRP